MYTYLFFSILRIAGINYGEDHEEIEYMVNGPRDEHRLPLQELLSQMVTDVATGRRKKRIVKILQFVIFSNIKISTFFLQV